MANEFPVYWAGYLAAITGPTQPVASPPVAGKVTGAFFHVHEPPSGGPVTIDVEVLGGPSATVTIPDGQRSSGFVGMSLDYGPADQLVYRVTAVSGTPSDLGGYIQAEPADVTPTGVYLCTVQDVKDFMNITDAESDSILNTIVAAVSEQIERWLGWRILQQTYTERYDGGYHTIQPTHGPVEDIATVDIKDHGKDVDADELTLLDGGWTIGRFKNDYPYSFTRGQDALEVTYTGGLSTVPADFRLAATMQSAYVWRTSGHGNNILGMARRAETGGVSTAEYQLDPILPKVQAMLDPYRSRF